MYSDDDRDGDFSLYHRGGDRDDDEAQRRRPQGRQRSRSRGRSQSPRSRGGVGAGRGRADDDRDASKGSKGKGKTARGPRTTGRELPKLYSIHKGTIVSVQTYGAFVRLGDGSEFKDGLMHVSRLSATGRVESVSDIVAPNDTVWVKVVDVNEEAGKFGVDMRHVNQTTGADKDPNNVQVDSGGGKGKGGKAEPIRIGAVQATTCTRCGAAGHGARECFASAGSKYELLEEVPQSSFFGESEPPPPVVEEMDPKAAKDAKVIKAALKAMIKGTKADAASSSSSSSSSSKKKQKKEKKKEKKLLKKQLKKEAKEQKKRIKELKKKLKAEKELEHKSEKAKKEDKEEKAKRDGKAEKEQKARKTEKSIKDAKDKGGKKAARSSSS